MPGHVQLYFECSRRGHFFFFFCNLLVIAFIIFFSHLLNTKQEHCKKLITFKKHCKTQRTVQTIFDVCYLKRKNERVQFCMSYPDCMYKVKFFTLCPRFLPVIQGAT